MKVAARFILVFTVAVLLLPHAVFADSGSFSNPAPITINDTTAATPFPSSIAVAGISGIINDVNVTIYGFSHTCPNDVEVLLAGPGGQNVLLMARVGTGLSCPDSVNADITFDDQAGSLVPYPPSTGTFKPTSEDNTDVFSGYGGPASPYGADLSVFNATNPNGTWNLYVVDVAEGDVGSISGGWSLDISTAASGTCLFNPPSTAVVGAMNTPTQAYYAPGYQANGVVMNPGTYYVLGVDQSGQYDLVVLSCQLLWVPVGSMAPNYDSVWNGRPLPTIVYPDNAANR